MSHTLSQHPVLVGCKNSLATLVLTARIDSDSITGNQDRQWCFLMEQFSKNSCTKRGKHKKRKTQKEEDAWLKFTYCHNLLTWQCEKAKCNLMMVLILSRGQNYYSGDNKPICHSWNKYFMKYKTPRGEHRQNTLWHTSKQDPLWPTSQNIGNKSKNKQMGPN